MRWLESGTGLPVVMVHGIPTSAELWRAVLPRVAGRALAWEMVGYGGSIPAGRGRDLSVARQAEHLTSWMRELGLERALLVGHDLGGGVAQIVAERSAGRCAGLVLINSIAYDAWPVWPVKVVQRLHGLVSRLPDTVVGPALRAVLRRMHDTRAVGVVSARIHWGHYRRHGGVGSLVRQARALDPGDTIAVGRRLPDLGLRARVLWGTADRFLGTEVGWRLARDLGTTVRRIPGARHFVPEDHPAAVASAINELVDLA